MSIPSRCLPIDLQPAFHSQRLLALSPRIGMTRALSVCGVHGRLSVGCWLLVASLAAFAQDTAGGRTGETEEGVSRSAVPAEVLTPTSHTLLTQLQAYLRQKNIDVDSLSARAMVDVMTEWFRISPLRASGANAQDRLVFRYGGWSEGCATAFRFSVLRQVTAKNATGGEIEGVAGMTLIFEPSAQANMLPYSTTSSDWKSIDDFLQAIASSAAWRELAGTAPMSAFVESGALR